MLSIVIVNYYTGPLVAAAVASIKRTIGTAEHEIIVVDNSRVDGVEAVLRADGSDVRVVVAPRNLGFGAACNLAGNTARGDRILLVNPDVEVLPGAIQALTSFADTRPRGGIYGGRTVRGDGSLNPTSCWRAMSSWSLLCRVLGLDTAMPDSGFFNHEGYGGWDRRVSREVEAVSGCFMLIDKALWEQLGGFDERFFVYGEDVDLCLRARALGYRPCITPGATVVHVGGGSEPVKAGKLIRLIAAKIQLARKHARGPRAVVQVALLKLWPLSRYLAFALARRIGLKRAEDALDTWRTVWRGVSRPLAQAPGAETVQ